MPKHVTPHPPLTRAQRITITKLAHGGMGARQIAKRVGVRVEVVRELIARIEP